MDFLFILRRTNVFILGRAMEAGKYIVAQPGFQPEPLASDAQNLNTRQHQRKQGVMDGKRKKWISDPYVQSKSTDAPRLWHKTIDYHCGHSSTPRKLVWPGAQEESAPHVWLAAPSMWS